MLNDLNPEKIDEISVGLISVFEGKQGMSRTKMSFAGGVKNRRNLSLAGMNIMR